MYHVVKAGLVGLVALIFLSACNSADIGSSGTVVQAKITGFGSVFDGTREWHTDNASIYIDGQQVGEDALVIRMLARISGEPISATEGNATRIDVNSLALGPIQGHANSGGTVSYAVSGIHIRYDLATPPEFDPNGHTDPASTSGALRTLDSLADDDVVRLFGQVDETTCEVTPTVIQLVSVAGQPTVGPFHAVGNVASLASGSLVITTGVCDHLNVSYDDTVTPAIAPAGLADGDFVRVSGTTPATFNNAATDDFVAGQIELVNGGSRGLQLPVGIEFETLGTVVGLSGDAYHGSTIPENAFVLNNQVQDLLISYDPQQVKLKNGLTLDDLQRADAFLKIEGKVLPPYDNLPGLLVLTLHEAKSATNEADHHAEIAGVVQETSTDPNRPWLRLLNRTVYIPAQAIQRDESDHHEQYFGHDDIQVGDYLKFKVALPDASAPMTTHFVALEAKRKDHPSRRKSKLEGRYQDGKINGVPVMFPAGVTPDECMIYEVKGDFVLDTVTTTDDFDGQLEITSWELEDDQPANPVCGVQPLVGIMRVSIDDTGVEGNSSSANSSVSADGRYVAFHSFASNLVPGDTNHNWDIFVHDTVDGVTTRVSVDSTGAESDNVSFHPSISADGRYVAFRSLASNLVAGDGNGRWDIFVHDRTTGITTRVSVDSAGAEANGSSYAPFISADGRYVAFHSGARNLVPGDTNGTWDIYLHDRTTGTTRRVSVNDAGQQDNNSSVAPTLSADGRYVAFYSIASNLVPGDTNGTWDVFVHDNVAGGTVRVSVDSAGAEANSNSYAPSISGDGRYVAFYSLASNLIADDTNRIIDVFVHDTTTGTTSRVSVDSAGAESNGASVNPSISADGRYVAFHSLATNLVTGDSNLTSDIFVHDTVTGTTTRLSVDDNGGEGDKISISPCISADGRYVAFRSFASNLVTDDQSGEWDVFRAPNTHGVLR